MSKQKQILVGLAMGLGLWFIVVTCAFFAKDAESAASLLNNRWQLMTFH